MSDIRSFFGGGGATKPIPSKKEDKATKSAKLQRARKVVSDDEEDDPAPVKSKKSTPVKAKQPVKEELAEETTSSAYFASNKGKSQKATPIRSKHKPTTEDNTTTPVKPKTVSTPSSRRSARNVRGKNYTGESDSDTRVQDDGEGDGADDIHADHFARNPRNGDDYEEVSDDEPVKLTSKKPARASKVKKSESSDDELEVAAVPQHDGSRAAARQKPAAKAATTNGTRKRKSNDFDDDHEDTAIDQDDEKPKKKARKTTTAKSPAKKKATKVTKADEVEDSKEVQDILASIPTIKAPSPPPPSTDGKSTFKFGAGNAANAPAAQGTKEIPEGAEDCLAGMNFVFTGVLESLSRTDGQNLVKKYGGKVMGAPSKTTTYVVLGNEAGPKKLQVIHNLGIKTINEDGLFELIRRMPPSGGGSKAAEKHAEKQAKDEEKIRKDAEEMELREKEREREAARIQNAAGKQSNGRTPVKKADPRVEDRLWVDKYAPDAITSVCGNKGLVEGLQNWLRNWDKRAKYNFKQAGPDGKGIYRAAMIHGPPGIGKTTAAHLVAKLEGFDVVESNASDTRSKKLVEAGLTGVLDTTSLLGYFSGDGKSIDAKKKKLVLIMDEVDGMSAGDRGGVGALAAVAKKTKIPMILICNERRLPKMKPFDHVTADFAFRRPTTDQIRGRIATICYREGLRLPPQVLNAIIEGTHADIRQIINMVSTIKVDNKEVGFDDGKQMSKAWEKHVILKPWDIVSKILRPQMFSPSSTATLNDKIELYFNDHEFSYLMLQENYLKTQPAGANDASAKQRNLKLLELAGNAAESISDGDLVDRMIHGSQQQWSLMPTHAVFSFVRPASYMYGNFNTNVGFASWLGMNSKQGKLSRYVKELQGHMRLRSSGDRHEIRQQYLPAIWQRTVGSLRDSGKDSVQDVIDFMDSYYLTKDDYDALIELGVGPMDEKELKMDSTIKAAFTRAYNAQSHPMPFIKASAVGNAAAKFGGGAKKDRPDLEEAIEDDDEIAAEGALDEEAKDEADDGTEELDLKKDKYIKAPKKKAAAKAGDEAAKKGKGKRVKDEEDDDDAIVSGDEKPKKKRGAVSGGAGRGRGRGRGK